MVDSEQLSALIGDIYDAALDPALWPAVVRATSGFVGGGSCNLSRTDSLNHDLDVFVDWGSDPHYMHLMATEYGRIYPLPPLIMAYARPGDLVWADMLMPYEEFVRTRFYREWAKPQGLCDAVGVVLEKSATAFATVTVMLYERHGRVDDGVRERMRLLGPHFRRAVAIGRILEQRPVLGSSYAAVLDSVSAGIFLLDRSGRLVRSNAAGERLLERGHPLHRQAGRLAAPAEATTRALDEAVAQAIRGRDGGPAQGTALPLGETIDEGWVAHVLPLSPGRQDPAADAPAAAAVFVQRVTLDRPHALEAVAKHYRITPAEMRVLVCVTEANGIREIAGLLGCAETTVRTHLRRIFEKTGARRQADVIKLLASFSGPLG